MDRAIVRVGHGQIANGIRMSIGINVSLNLKDPSGRRDVHRTASQSALDRGRILSQTLRRKAEHHGADELHHRRFPGFVVAAKNCHLIRNRFNGQAFPYAKTVYLKISYLHRVSPYRSRLLCQYRFIRYSNSCLKLPTFRRLTLCASRDIQLRPTSPVGALLLSPYRIPEASRRTLYFEPCWACTREG